MRKTKYAVELSEAERARLRTLVGSGAGPARAARPGPTRRSPGRRRSTPPRSPACGAPSSRTAWRRPWRASRRIGRTRALDGAAEARLVALACGAPPAGRERWTLRLLADALVRLEVVEGVSHETVRRALKQTSSSRG